MILRAILALTLSALLLGAPFLCAWAMARRVFRGPRQALLAALLLHAGLVSALFHSTLSAGAFGLPLMLAPFGTGAVFILWRDRGSVAALARAGRGIARQLRTAFPLRKLWAWGPFALLAAIVAARGIFLPPLAHDSLSYHLAKAAMWIQTGGINELTGPGGWSFYRIFPGGWEALLAVAMLPAHSDAAAAALDVAAWLGLGWAAWEVARALGARGPAAGAAAVFALFLPASFRAAGACYVENAQAFFLLVALLFQLRYRRAGNPAAWAASITALGLAAAVKSFLWPVIALMGVLLVVDALRRPRRPGATRLHLFGASLAAVVFLPWLGWAWVFTGAPLSPFPVKLAGLELGRAGPMIRWYLDRPGVVPYDPAQESLAFWSVFHLPETAIPQIGITALVAVGVTLVTALLRRRAGRVTGLAYAVMIALAAVALFYSPLYATNRLHAYWSFANGRFLHFAFVLLGSVGAAVACRACNPRLAALPLVLAGLLSVLGSLFSGWTALEIRWVPALAVAGLGVAMALVTRRALWILPAGGVAAVVFGIGMAMRAQNRWEMWREGLGIHVMKRGWIEPARKVNGPAVIAVTSGPDQNGDNWMLYPFLGPDWENRLVHVPPYADGRVREFAGPDALLPGASFEAWSAGLEKAGATHVMSFAPDSIELMWMLENPRHFRPLVGGPGWGLFLRVKPE